MSAKKATYGKVSMNAHFRDLTLNKKFHAIKQSDSKLEY